MDENPGFHITKTTFTITKCLIVSKNRFTSAKQKIAVANEPLVLQTNSINNNEKNFK